MFAAAAPREASARAIGLNMRPDTVRKPCCMLRACASLWSHYFTGRPPTASACETKYSITGCPTTVGDARILSRRGMILTRGTDLRADSTGINSVQPVA